MLISHEVPKCLFENSIQFNDYDYALVHLFDKDPEYLNFYKRCVKQGRHVLLDNSIFELGTAYDNKLFAKWVEELKPTEENVVEVKKNTANIASKRWQELIKKVMSILLPIKKQKLKKYKEKWKS